MKYLIREVGWVFNDATYDNDGEYRTLKIFDSLDDAKKEKKELEFEFFLYKLPNIHNYESYGEPVSFRTNYKAKVTNYLVDEFNFNPTILLVGHRGFSAAMFLKELSEDDVQELLQVMNINFFSIVEVEDSKITQYEAKINPIYNESRESFLYDENGMTKLKFTSKLDAFKRFLSKGDFYSLRIKLDSNIDVVSKIPTVFISLIQSLGMEIMNGNLKLSREINPIELMQFNELLIEPLLLFIEIEDKDVEKQFASILTNIKRENNSEKSIINEQSNKFLADENYRFSKEYLMIYAFILNMDPRFYNYNAIINRYICKKTGNELIYKFGQFFYNLVLIKFYGVIKSLNIQEGKYLIESCFGFGVNPNLDIEKTAFGCNENLENAFDESLENWLDIYGDEYIDYLHQMNNYKT